MRSNEPQWNLLFEDNEHPLNHYISAFYSAKQSSDLAPDRSWDIFYPAEGIIKEIMDCIIQNCTRSVEKVDAFDNPYLEQEVNHVKDFYVLRVDVLTTVDKAFIITPNILKIHKNQYLLKIDTSINLKRSEKQNLVEQFTGEIDSSGYVWLELSDTKKQRLMDLYKTPSVYRHGLDISKRVGKLIFFEDERLYPNCPILILCLPQYKAEILKKIEEYNELTPSRPNKWVTLRRSASITLPDRSKRMLYDYYLDKPKIFYNYRVEIPPIKTFPDLNL